METIHTLAKGITISVVFTATEILKWTILTFVLFLKVIFSKWNQWVNLSNNISPSGNMTIETLHLYFPATCNHQTLYSGDLGDGLSTTNSHIHLIMWSRDVKGQINHVSPPLLQDLQKSKLAQWWLNSFMTGFYMITASVMKELIWGAPTSQFTWQNKNVISPVQEDLLTSNLKKW